LTINDNWSAYDELSDNIPLTEELAMRELRELIRLKRQGVQVQRRLSQAPGRNPPDLVRKRSEGL
jgi:hypothetical protein